MKNKILLHACCAPCLTAVHEKLVDNFDIDIFWYNPNIYPLEEEKKRLGELDRYAKSINANLIICPFDQRDVDNWNSAVVNYANLPEGQRRCSECIYFRMKKLVEFAKKEKYKRVGTTLSVSPRKNVMAINEAGKKASVAANVDFLEADFKKNDGYLRSVQISKDFGLYRQNYCGCTYSKNEVENRLNSKQING